MAPWANVQNLVPGAKAGLDEHRIEGLLGIEECPWKNAPGDVPMLLQDPHDSGASAKADATGFAERGVGAEGRTACGSMLPRYRPRIAR